MRGQPLIVEHPNPNPLTQQLGYLRLFFTHNHNIINQSFNMFSFYVSAVTLFPQAQARMQESSQKVDLLRLSLERRLSELPPDNPKCAAIKEELLLGTSPSYGTPKKLSKASSSSSFFKPASLTG